MSRFLVQKSANHVNQNAVRFERQSQQTNDLSVSLRIDSNFQGVIFHEAHFRSGTIYENSDGAVKVDVRLEDETVWLTQAHMCRLFGKDKRTISEHILNIFSEGELHEDSVVREFRSTASDGKNYNVNYYNLDVIISVGYRVKSQQGTHPGNPAGEKNRNGTPTRIRNEHVEFPQNRKILVNSDILIE